MHAINGEKSRENVRFLPAGSAWTHLHVMHPSGLYLYPLGHAWWHSGCTTPHAGRSVVFAAERQIHAIWSKLVYKILACSLQRLLMATATTRRSKTANNKRWYFVCGSSSSKCHWSLHPPIQILYLSVSVLEFWG